MMQEKKQTLFRFLDFEGGLETIRNRKVRFKKACQFNDPYDLQPRSFFPYLDIESLTRQELILELIKINIPPFCFLDKNEVREKLETMNLDSFVQLIKNNTEAYVTIARELFDNYRNTNTILCLSQRIDDVKMWANYSGKGTGIAIEFKVGDGNIFTLAKKVTYYECTPKFYNSYSELINSSFENSKEIIYEQLFEYFSYSKSMHWKDEREWRIIYPYEGDEHYYDYEIKKEDIVSIYLGYGFKNIEENIEIIRKTYGSVDIYTSDICEERYGLVFKKSDF